MSNSVELLNNAQFGAAIGSGNSSYRCRDVLTGIEFNLSFAGARSDHYDVTPTTEHDANEMVRSIGGIDNMGSQGWVARPVIIYVGPRLIAAGLNTFMHHIRIGRSNPGSRFPSLNEQPPWTRWGGHCCLYVSNSIGGAGNENSTNIHARAEANERANTPRGRGRQARAACHEAFMRSQNASPAPAPETPQSTTHTVVSGDTLSAIARRFNTTIDILMHLNNLVNPDKIRIGQVLRLPYGNNSTPTQPAQPVDAIAREVIQGRWGDGQERIDRLTAAGHNHAVVQARVRELMGV